MRRRDTIRYFAGALAAALVLLAGGCGKPARHAGPPPPEVRIQGARILDADQEESVAPAPAAPEGPPPRRELAKPTVPADLARDVRVTLDVVDARASEVLRALAYQGNVDLVLASGTDRRLAVRLQDAPWTQAFQAVLDGANLVAECDGRRIRVLAPDQLRTEREAADRLEGLRPLTEIIPLHNLYAKETAASFSSVLSSSGRIGVDEERNALVVTDAPSRIAAIRQAVQDLDRTPGQVMIEAIIVDVTLNDELHTGFDWSVLHAGDKKIDLKQTLTVGAGTNPVTNPGAALGFTIKSGDWTLSAVYDMLQKQDNVKVLANPRVLAVNNRKANIEIIEEIPYQVLTQTQQGGQIGTTSFKEVGVKLEVTPRLAADGGIHLQLTAEQSAPTKAAINQIPVIQTRRSGTVMSVRDGQVIAIGGLRRRHSTTNEDKVPVAGDWPIVGLLFRRVETVEVETELVIFIRPKVVRPGQPLTARERTLAEAIDHLDRRPQVIRVDPLRLHVEEEDARARRVPPFVATPGKPPAAKQTPRDSGKT